MTDRCEPPPELRGVDGWHWLDLAGFTRPAPYHWIAGHQGWEELGLKRPADYIYCDGYRYLAPVTPPATVAALVEALEAAVECGLVPKSSATEGGAMRFSRQVAVADQIRAALALYRGDNP